MDELELSLLIALALQAFVYNSATYGELISKNSQKTELSQCKGLK